MCIRTANDSLFLIHKQIQQEDKIRDAGYSVKITSKNTVDNTLFDSTSNKTI